MIIVAAGLILIGFVLGAWVTYRYVMAAVEDWLVEHNLREHLDDEPGGGWGP